MVFVFRPANRMSVALGLFLRWVRAQGRSPHAPSISENASDPVDIPIKGVPQAPDDKPNPSEEGQSLEGRPPEARGISSDKTHPT